MKYEKYNWFYAAAIDGVQAETLLNKVAKDGCFLVRISSTKKYYVLTLYCGTFIRPKVVHYHIYQTTGGRFHFDQQYDYYPTLPALIEHYNKCKHNLPCLLKCTPKGALLMQPTTVAPARVLTPVPAPNKQPRRCEGGPAKCVCKWQIGLNELEMMAKIGQGSFGVVHQAKLRGSTLVAVKMMVAGSMSEEAFIKEAHAMTELKHPHIVRLCGICTKKKQPIFIVTEYMKHGALILYLRKYKKTLIKRHQSLINICAQVASGMAYLEQQQFIHRDLASRNCLVGANGEVKVSDFGMSKFMDSSSYQGNMASLIPIYSVPPEVLSKRLFSSKSDVWAFGLLMWEVFTCGDAPYGHLSTQEVRKYVEKGYILDQPDAAKYEDYDIMTRCWAYGPEKRPTFAQLEGQLRTIAGV